MSAPERCTGCGAAIAGGAAACSYCGTGGGAVVASTSVAPDPASERAARFERVRATPSFERFLAFRPDSSAVSGALLGPAFFGLAFAGFGVFFIVVSSLKSDAFGGAPIGGMFILIPIGFVLLGLGMLVASTVKWRAFTSAPHEAFPALVVAKRTKVVGQKNGTRTTYFVTVETERGRRVERPAPDEVYGVVDEDDVGVAYVRGGHLLGFRTVDA
jgi:hypothetical protein